MKVIELFVKVIRRRNVITHINKQSVKLREMKPIVILMLISHERKYTYYWF